MSPHLIQLRAAWTALQPAPDSPPKTHPGTPLVGFAPTPFPVRFPAPGSVRLLRYFNTPSRLEPGDRVCLLLSLVGELRGAWLGDSPLEFTPLPVSPLSPAQRPPATTSQPGQQDWRAELTPLLQRRNPLILDLASPPHGGPGELALVQAQIEIHSPPQNSPGRPTR
ncbi:MAG: hypothetical protein ACKOJF_18195 [Planctomycetaceae bacterium]